MLREKIPDFVPAFWSGSEDVVPRVREPVRVAFRSGASMTELFTTVAGNKSVVVEAAPGAGKSTVVPAGIAEHVGCLVLHVFPASKMASYTAGYLGTTAKLISTVDQSYPESGVAYISAACVVAKWLAAGRPVLPTCVVYHDECHESDAFTYLVKLFSPVLASVRSYVKATATLMAEGFRTLETAGTLARGTYSGAPTSWDPYESGKPWSITSMRDNVLLFVDSKSLSTSLVDTYKTAGFSAYRLHSRMEDEAFERVMAVARDPSSPIVVLVADSTFRNGYTMPVGDIVDSGKVSYMDTSTGRPVRRERVMYAGESYQTAARGARVAGQKTKYWTNQEQKFEHAICDLESVDAEAVALIIRCLGYKPPSEFRDCRMFSGTVPRDVCLALQREQPLALIPEDQMVELVQLSVPSGRRSPFLAKGVEIQERLPLDVSDDRVSADTARATGTQKYLPAEDWSEQWHDDLRELMDLQPAVVDMQLGKAYYASGLETDVDRSPVVFPEGADSVLRYLGDRQHVSHTGLSAWHRSIAINMLLTRQSGLAAEMDGIGRAVRYAKSGASVRKSVASTRLATQIAERLSSVSTSLTVVNAGLKTLGAGFCSYHEMDINIPLSDEVFSNWSVAWDTLPIVDNRKFLTEAKTLRREGAQAAKMLTDSVGSRVADRPYVPMSHYGGGMRAARVYDSMHLSSKSSSGSGGSDDRCVGSTYFQSSLRRDPTGQLCTFKTLVCDICGVGASKKKHGFK